MSLRWMIALIVLTASVNARTQELVALGDSTGTLTMNVPLGWMTVTRSEHISGSMPSSHEVFMPTVSLTAETVDGARKRLSMYMSMFYAEQYAQEHQPTEWKTVDTVWNGIKAAHVEYRSPYGDHMLRTAMTVAVDGDKAYIVRCMAIADGPTAEWNELLAVAQTTRRIQRP